MADMMESPPLFDNETKLDDLEDDDEDIFASAVQVSSDVIDTSQRDYNPRRVRASCAVNHLFIRDDKYATGAKYVFLHPPKIELVEC